MQTLEITKAFWRDWSVWNEYILESLILTYTSLTHKGSD